MLNLRKFPTYRLAFALALVIFTVPNAGAKNSFGVRGGFASTPDQFVIGGQAELGRALQTARFAPSVDVGLGSDLTAWTLNADFRWYLFNLPESGIKFYGSAGPTLVLASAGKGGSNSSLGLSLVAGMRIPMKSGRRYNLEARFGIGDIPDFKLMLGILF